MILVDSEIKSIGEDLIEGYKEESVTNIGYDLTSKNFVADHSRKSEITIEPFETVFVEADECIRLPGDIVGRVVLKNSRLRQGLHLDAPVYQPGHYTRVFFRLTNMSSDAIVLKSGESYAYIIFDRLSMKPENQYIGAFRDEMSFSGLAGYGSAYRDQIVKIEEKKDELKGMERGIYANVLVILTVFVALFSFLTTNISLLSGGSGLNVFVLYNFVLLGCISFLINMICVVTDTKRFMKLYWLFPVLFFAVALITFVFS